MKRQIVLILASLCLVFLCACSQGGGTPEQVDTEESQASLETKMADEVEKDVGESDAYYCDADFFSQGGSVFPMKQAECDFQITYISKNGMGGYDWDFTLENHSATSLTVSIMAYKTEQTSAAEARTWRFDSEPGDQISDIISWEQPYTVFNIRIDSQTGDTANTDFIVEYH